MIPAFAQGGDASADYLALHTALGNTQALTCRERRQLTHLQLNCEIYQAGDSTAPLVLFFPGLATYSELYAQLLQEICSGGFNVISVDPPGHGYSAGERGLYQVEQFCGAVSDLLDEVSAEFSGPVIAFGYSIGALLAVAAAEQELRITKVICNTLLVTEEPPDWWHYVGWQWLWGSALYMPRWRLPLNSFLDFRRLIEKHPAAEFLNRDPLLVLHYPLATLASVFHHRAGIMQQSYPFQMLLIQAENDTVLSLSYAQRVVSRAVQPVELITVASEGHMLPLQSPLKLAGIVVEWLKAHL